jgi:hypothetical protein
MATELPILQCTLDAEGAKRQRARYAHLAAHTANVTRTADSVIAAVDVEVDPDLLNELINTERACCPFFTIEYDGERLTVAVAHTEHTAALDVIEEALQR